MKKQCLAHRRTAFTLVEMMVVLVILGLLAMVVLPKLAVAKKRSDRIRCVSNLKQIGLAYRLYAIDNGDQFPWETNQQARLEQYFWQCANELATPKILVCPRDTGRMAATSITQGVFVASNHLSYFVNVGAKDGEENIMLGDRYINASGVVTSSIGVAWGRPGVTMHGDTGNLALSDGSVQQVNTSRLRLIVDAALTNGCQIDIRLPE